MSSIASPSTRTTSVYAITAAAVVGSILAYVVYFDYKRRNDVEFRRKLRAEKKQMKKKAEKQAEEVRQTEARSLSMSREEIMSVFTKSKEELANLPTDQQERMNYCINLLSAGDQLIKDMSTFKAAAAVYFKCLCLYPNPLDLIGMYDANLPKPVMEMVMELYNVEVSENYLAQLVDEQNGGDSEERNERSSETPSEASLQDWDKVPEQDGEPFETYSNTPFFTTTTVSQVLARIRGYYDEFPPKSMNVAVSPTSDAQGRTHTLVAMKDFSEGEEIYQEDPLVAALNFDAHKSGSYCGYCFKHIDGGVDTSVEPDLLRTVFCSQQCNLRLKLQTDNFLFGEGPALPLGIDNEPSSEAKADRKEAQEAFIELWNDSKKTEMILVARLTALQINAEVIKAIPNADSLRTEFPQTCFFGDYSVSDHMERLRYIDQESPKTELRAMQHLLAMTMPSLAASHTDERYNIMKGKIAYNRIGIVDNSQPGDCEQATPEDFGHVRSTEPRSKLIGNGLYIISSYIHHSCTPSVRIEFKSGTNRLHLVANRDIKKLEELTAAYIDISRKDEPEVDFTERRMKELRDGWRFACTCPMCSTPGADVVLDAGAKFEERYKHHIDGGLYTS